MNKLKARDFHTHLRENLKDKKFKQYFDEHGKQLEDVYSKKNVIGLIDS